MEIDCLTTRDPLTGLYCVAITVGRVVTNILMMCHTCIQRHTRPDWRFGLRVGYA